MQKRRWELVLALVVSVMLVGSVGVFAAPVTIDFAVWGGAAEMAELMEIIDDINARNADKFQINVINIPGEYYDKIQIMIAGGTAPDIFYLDQNWTPAFASRDVLLPLDDLIANDPEIDLADYFPASLESARFNGRIYGLPWIAQPVVMYYNRTMFTEAGIAHPDNTFTWDEFLTTAKSLTKDLNGDGRIDQYGYIQSLGWPPFEAFVWQNGGKVYSDDGTKVLLDSPEAIEALQFMADLVHVHKVSPSMSTIEQMGNVGDFFRSGQIGMFFGGAADGFYEIERFEIGVAPLPYRKVRATQSWVANLHIYNGVDNLEIVWDAYKQILDGIHHWKVVPPRFSLAKDLQSIEPRMPADRVAPILESMEYAYSPRAFVNQNRINTIFVDNFWLPLLRDGNPAVEVVKELKRLIEPLIK